MTAGTEQWDLHLTLERLPTMRQKGPISQQQVAQLLDRIHRLAKEEGYALGGLPRAKRTNCPHCGKILRGPPGGRPLARCPWCSQKL